MLKNARRRKVLKLIWKLKHLTIERISSKYDIKHVPKQNREQKYSFASSPGEILNNLKVAKIQWRKSGSVTSSELAEDNIEPVS